MSIEDRRRSSQTESRRDAASRITAWHRPPPTPHPSLPRRHLPPSLFTTFLPTPSYTSSYPFPYSFSLLLPISSPFHPVPQYIPVQIRPTPSFPKPSQLQTHPKPKPSPGPNQDKPQLKQTPSTLQAARCFPAALARALPRALQRAGWASPEGRLPLTGWDRDRLANPLQFSVSRPAP